MDNVTIIGFSPAMTHWPAFLARSISLCKVLVRAVLMLVLTLLTSLVYADTFRGKVIKVVDGDTVWVMDSEYHKEKIRLMGIDSPEPHQAYGRVASTEMAYLVAGKQVTVQWEKRDRDHRIVGKVLVSTECETCPMDTDAGLRLIQAGLAWHYKQFAKEQSVEDRRVYSDAEMAAREQRIGLWTDPNPVSPWEWRKAKKLNQISSEFP